MNSDRPTPLSITIRRLEPQDAKAALDLRLAGLKESPSAFASSYEEERDLPLAAIEARLADMPDRGYFGAFDGGKLVGVVVLDRQRQMKQRHISLIWGMYVAPEARGKGMGRELMRAALSLASSVADIRQVRLAVNAANAAAIRLYESLGFEPFGTERDALRVDDRFHDEIHMALHLRQA